MVRRIKIYREMNIQKRIKYIQKYKKKTIYKKNDINKSVKAYNTASYKHCKFFCSYFSTANEFTVLNSQSFVDSLRDVADAENLYMSSFDVSNLFTNVPLDETINICLDSLYTSSNDTIIGLPRNLFKQFLELSVKNSFFVFNSKLHKQLDGV